MEKGCTKMQSISNTNTATKLRFGSRVKTSKENEQLIQDILVARREINTVLHNIDFVDDDMLMEHFIFKLKACELRYRYLITQAKERGISHNEYAEKLIAERYCR